MAPKAKGLSVLEIARGLMAKALTANELRICQAVIFPLQYGMTTKQTASCIGRSVGWTTRSRNAFIKAGGFAEKARPGGRKRANMTIEEEKDFLGPFLEKARVGGILVVGDIHRALEERLGRKVALASAYNLLHRHDWRKLAPDKRHVKADLEAQANWKKNCPNS
jgi:transposase